MNVCVIPARGGSKRIPRKNIRPFAGKPIIAWSIETALASGCFDEVVVSSDDPEIIDVATKYGATAPFIRPTELAGDYVATLPVITHAIGQMPKCRDGVICCLYPTAPLLSIDDLLRGFELVRESGADFVCSVTSYDYPIQRALSVDGAGFLRMIDYSHLSTRTQDLEEVWHDAGQFYFGFSSSWINATQIFSETTVPLVLKRSNVVDIDTIEDWDLAEAIFLARMQVNRD